METKGVLFNQKGIKWDIKHNLFNTEELYNAFSGNKSSVLFPMNVLISNSDKHLGENMSLSKRLNIDPCILNDLLSWYHTNCYSWWSIISLSDLLQYTKLKADYVFGWDVTSENLDNTYVFVMGRK